MAKMIASKRNLVNGVFVSHKENKAESDEAYARAGTTRARVEEERLKKRIKNLNVDDSKKQSMLLETLDDDALEKELAARRAERKAPRPEVAAPQSDQGGSTVVPKKRKKDEAVVVETGENFDHLTVPQLKAELKLKGIKFNPRSGRPKLLELLENDGVTVDNAELEEDEDL